MKTKLYPEMSNNTANLDYWNTGIMEYYKNIYYN